VLYGSLHLPEMLPHDDQLHAILRMTHTALAYMFFATILLHVAAALFHALILGTAYFEPWQGSGLGTSRPTSKPRVGSPRSLSCDVVSMVDRYLISQNGRQAS
jgi:hypothetical protein